jgi:hypothetical protein
MFSEQMLDDLSDLEADLKKILLASAIPRVL